jgi:hypothetical protein
MNVDWNDTVLAHPELEITDKMVYHLLQRFGGDHLEIRRHIAGLLNRSERHIRRVCDKLHQCGFGMEARTPMSKNGHPGPKERTPRSENGHPGPKARTPMSESDAHVPNRTPMSEPLTRTRTSRSSSNEEDKYVLLPLSPPEGNLGEEGKRREEESIQEDEFTTSIKALWDLVDPDRRDYPEAWFARLKKEFGADRPLWVLEQFIKSGRTLADLKQPAAYQRYFATCCRNAPLSAVSESFSDGDYDLDLEELYRADHEKLQAECEREMEEFYREERSGQ